MSTFLEQLEEKLKLYPYQWFNFFKFWSTIPEPLNSLGNNKKDIKLELELK